MALESIGEIYGDKGIKDFARMVKKPLAPEIQNQLDVNDALLQEGRITTQEHRQRRGDIYQNVWNVYEDRNARRFVGYQPTPTGDKVWAVYMENGVEKVDKSKMYDTWKTLETNKGIFHVNLATGEKRLLLEAYPPGYGTAGIKGQPFSERIGMFQTTIRQNLDPDYTYKKVDWVRRRATWPWDDSKETRGMIVRYIKRLGIMHNLDLDVKYVTKGVVNRYSIEVKGSLQHISPKDARVRLPEGMTPAPPGRETTEGIPSATPGKEKITDELMDRFIDAADGDVDEARRMAIEKGYTW